MVKRIRHSAKHPGFKAVAQKIATRMNIPVTRANAILAAAARKTSRQGLLRNPRISGVFKPPRSGHYLEHKGPTHRVSSFPIRHHRRSRSRKH